MFRQCVSITLVISLVALGVSGVLMIFLNSLSFQLQMHPVHKIFGIIMVVAGCFHLFLNFKPIKRYLTSGKILGFGAIMSLLLVLLCVAGANKPLNQDVINQVEQLMLQIEPKQ